MAVEGEPLEIQVLNLTPAALAGEKAHEYTSVDDREFRWFYKLSRGVSLASDDAFCKKQPLPRLYPLNKDFNDPICPLARFSP